MKDYDKVDMPTAETCGVCHRKQFKEVRKGITIWPGSA